MYKFSKRRQKVWLANHRRLRNKCLLTGAPEFAKHEYWLKHNHPKFYQRLTNRHIQWVPEGYYDRAFYFKPKK